MSLQKNYYGAFQSTPATSLSYLLVNNINTFFLEITIPVLSHVSLCGTKYHLPIRKFSRNIKRAVVNQQGATANSSCMSFQNDLIHYFGNFGHYKLDVYQIALGSKNFLTHTKDRNGEWHALNLISTGPQVVCATFTIHGKLADKIKNPGRCHQWRSLLRQKYHFV